MSDTQRVLAILSLHHFVPRVGENAAAKVSGAGVIIND
jgi:hypothetical protein